MKLYFFHLVNLLSRIDTTKLEQYISLNRRNQSNKEKNKILLIFEYLLKSKRLERK